jgi:hypothetical protein
LTWGFFLVGGCFCSQVLEAQQDSPSQADVVEVVMTFEVDAETKKVTTKCEKLFCCLTDGGMNLCRIKDCVDGNLHYVQCDELKYCSYKIPFGTARLCGCPTRKEIYAKYAI